MVISTILSGRSHPPYVVSHLWKNHPPSGQASYSPYPSPTHPSSIMQGTGDLFGVLRPNLPSW